MAVAESVNITDQDVHVVDSVVSGPLGNGLAALLIGRSSSSRQGIFVLPGLIDADYTGIIRIMLKVFVPPATILKGSRIAQLIPFQPSVPRSQPTNREQGAFGSTGKPLVILRESYQSATATCCGDPYWI